MTTMTRTGVFKDSVSHALLFAFSLFLCIWTIVLLLAGGLVTSNEAGLAVPDWPLSYGKWMPPMVGNIFWEHGHRMIAATVGFWTICLAVFLQIFEARAWMRRLGWIALAAVIFQGLLGGLTVKLMLPPAVSVFHACFAQAFFCLTLAIAYFLSPVFLDPDPVKQAERKPLFKLAFMTTVFIFVQLILGAVLRHTGHLIVPHIIFAVLVFLHVMLIAAKTFRILAEDALIRIPAFMLGLLVTVQVFLGLGSFIFTRALERGYEPSTGEVVFTAAHQTTGALILGICFLLVLITAQKKPANAGG